MTTLDRNKKNIELFAGSGGMAIGLKKAGFLTADLYDIDPKSCVTVEHNLRSKSATLHGQVHVGDISKISWDSLSNKIGLLAGGVPCQPFSLGGKHRAQSDKRNLFPEFIRAVREANPDAFLIENVRGLLRESFKSYFDYVLAQLVLPSLQIHIGESWHDHFERLEKEKERQKKEYDVSWKLFNSADYGIPQIRHRVFIVGVRSGGPKYKFPEPTHSKAALLKSQIQGQYWRERHLTVPSWFKAKYGKKEITEDKLLPWVTVRDAIQDLPDPSEEEEHLMNHWKIYGAKTYAGHLGSRLDWPSKTLKAGVHGVPGGENTVLLENGKVRYYTLREAARIQTFPDEHIFLGARLHVTRQIGNAVPCKLAEIVAKPLYDIVSGKRR
jgi:DNA (cytosine-5)-methyltransferase 1